MIGQKMFVKFVLENAVFSIKQQIAVLQFLHAHIKKGSIYHNSKSGLDSKTVASQLPADQNII